MLVPKCCTITLNVITHEALVGHVCHIQPDHRWLDCNLRIEESIDYNSTGEIRTLLTNHGETSVVIPEGAFVGIIEVVTSPDVINTVDIIEDELHCVPQPTKLEETACFASKDLGKDIDFKNSILDNHQKCRLISLINAHPTAFSMHNNDFGRTSLIKHTIELEPGAKPFHSRPYPVPHHAREELNKQMQKLKDGGMIKQSMGSRFSSPVILVDKKDKSKRMCIDFRKLNSMTVKVKQRLPTMDDVATVLSRKKYFTSLDFMSGFWQVELDPESAELTTFVLPNYEMYRWTVMPFGLCNSPSSFQRLMNTVFVDLVATGNCIVYVDDVLIANKTFEEHLDTLEKCFKRLIECGLKLKLSKASFCQRELTYLGHTISEEGIAPSEDNVKKLLDYPSPRDRRTVESLLGLLNYYRKHIPNYAKIAAPITSLLRRKNQKGAQRKIDWSEEAESAMRLLIKKITEYPILRFPIHEHGYLYILTTDASSIAVAGALSQMQDGHEYPISFYSRKLSEGQSKWCSSELECFGIVASVNHFRQFLLGVKFKIYTDNTGCLEILKKPDLSGRLRRWALMLGDMEFTLHHKPGKINPADGLSRVGAVQTIKRILGPDDVKQAQKEDSHISNLITYLRLGEFPIGCTSTLKRMIERESVKFEVLKGVLFRKRNEKRSVVVIPGCLKDLMLREFHESLEGMHYGIHKCVENLLEVCWWPKLRQDVIDYIEACESCATVKDPQRRTKVPLKSQHADYPMQTISVDVAGPLVESERGNKYLLCFVDHFTRYVDMFAIPNQTAETVARIFVEEYITRYGVCENLLSDRGTNFLSELVSEVNRLLNINKKSTTPFHPATNSAVERVFRVVKTKLAHFCSRETQKDWDQYVPFIRYVINQSWHASTNYSPAYLFYGRPLLTPLKLLLPKSAPESVEGDYPEVMAARIQQVWELARVYMKASKEAQKFYYDRDLTPSKVRVGDRVYKHSPAGRKGLSTKLVHHWIGPFLVTKVSDTNAWIKPISKPNDTPKCVHLNNLKKYRGPNVPPEDSEEIDLEDVDSHSMPNLSNRDGDVDEVPILTKDTTIAVDGDSEQQVHLRTGDGPYNLRRRVVGRRDPNAVY